MLAVTHCDSDIAEVPGLRPGPIYFKHPLLESCLTNLVNMPKLFEQITKLVALKNMSRRSHPYISTVGVYAKIDNDNNDNNIILISFIAGRNQSTCDAGRAAI